MEKLRLPTIRESLMMENFPPGAANDPRAPYNQSSSDDKKVEFDSELEDSEGDKHPVHINYQYQEDRDGRKYITDYSHEFKPETTAIPNEYIDEMIRELISDNIGKNHEFTV